jgi:hypothetical protein
VFWEFGCLRGRLAARNGGHLHRGVRRGRIGSHEILPLVMYLRWLLPFSVFNLVSSSGETRSRPSDPADCVLVGLVEAAEMIIELYFSKGDVFLCVGLLLLAFSDGVFPDFSRSSSSNSSRYSSRSQSLPPIHEEVGDVQRGIDCRDGSSRVP